MLPTLRINKDHNPGAFGLVSIPRLISAPGDRPSGCSCLVANTTYWPPYQPLLLSSQYYFAANTAQWPTLVRFARWGERRLLRQDCDNEQILLSPLCDNMPSPRVLFFYRVLDTSEPLIQGHKGQHYIVADTTRWPMLISGRTCEWRWVKAPYVCTQVYTQACTRCHVWHTTRLVLFSVALQQYGRYIPWISQGISQGISPRLTTTKCDLNIIEL